MEEGNVLGPVMRIEKGLNAEHSLCIQRVTSVNSRDLNKALHPEVMGW